MADWLKIAVKAALVLVVMGIILVLFTSVQIPSVDFSVLSQGLGTALAVVFHYVPVMVVIFPVVLALLAFEVAFFGVRFALIGIKWVMKVNE
jgi:hypothetical protein